MRSNYRQLVQFIEPIDLRNKNRMEPLGLNAIKGISSIYKSFIKTKANLIGVSPGNYKVVKPNQFGFNPNTARMGDKIPIALNSGENEILVSSIYPTFKIIDENELLPEYLMMWFKRPEFDRYARFKSHGSAREIFDFDEMCGVKLPVPSIEKQRAIVKEYNSIVNRIKLNEQLNQKLEETAQALYKYWFVDFEFPNENGQAYKSSGGQLVYNEDLDKDIPNNWEVGTLELLGEIVGGATPLKAVSNYWSNDSNAIRWISPKDLTKENYKFIDKGKHFITELGYQKSSTKLMPPNSVLFSSRAPIGILGINTNELCTNQGFKSIVPFNHVGCHFVYYFLKFNTNDIAGQGSGTTFNEVSGTIMKDYPAYLPSTNLIKEFSSKMEKIFNHQAVLESKTKSLKKLRSILLSKISKVGSLKTAQLL